MARNRRFQQGSLFKRGRRTKVWVARWWEDTVGVDGALERVRRSEVLGTVADLPTRREAEEVLAERLRPINSGEQRPQACRTFEDFVEKTWMPDVLPTLKYSTRRYYEYIARVHLVPAFGERQLRLLLREDVQRFLAGKLQSGLSWKTVKHLRTALGTILVQQRLGDSSGKTRSARPSSLDGDTSRRKCQSRPSRSVGCLPHCRSRPTLWLGYWPSPAFASANCSPCAGRT